MYCHGWEGWGGSGQDPSTLLFFLILMFSISFDCASFLFPSIHFYISVGKICQHPDRFASSERKECNFECPSVFQNCACAFTIFFSSSAEKGSFHYDCMHIRNILANFQNLRYFIILHSCSLKWTTINTKIML